MKYNLLKLFLATVIMSCNAGDSKKEALLAKEIELIKREKALEIKERNFVRSGEGSSVVIREKNSSSNSKTMTMVFKEYSEGDLTHLIFQNVETMENYDFGQEITNAIQNSNILLADPTASFGYKANPVYINRQFTVEAINKTVLIADPLTGKGIESKAWIINAIMIKPSLSGRDPYSKYLEQGEEYYIYEGSLGSSPIRIYLYFDGRYTSTDGVRSFKGILITLDKTSRVFVQGDMNDAVFSAYQGEFPALDKFIDNPLGYFNGKIKNNLINGTWVDILPSSSSTEGNMKKPFNMKYIGKTKI